MKDIRIISCGYCTQNEKNAITTGKFKNVNFPAKCFLLPLKKGYILFDCGYSKDFYSVMSKFPYNIYAKLIPVHITKEETCYEQIKDIAQEVKYIFISHFHPDHIGGLKDFSQAEFICSKKEYYYLKHLNKFKKLLNGFIMEFIPEDFEERVIFIEDFNSAEKKPFDIVYKLPLEEELYAVNLCGHTKNQYGLLYSNKLFCADAAWDIRTFQNLELPSSFAFLFSYNKRKFKDTIKKINQLKDTEIYISHQR